jgi:O-antigen/teichoic acid export membrane protein
MSDAVKFSLKKAIEGSAIVFIGSVLSILIWFVTRLIIVRNLTKEEFGVYSIVIAVGGMSAAFATLGIHEAVPRYISIYSGRRDEGAVAFVSRLALKLGVLSGIIAASVMIILSDAVSRYVFYKPEIAPFLSIMSLFVFASIVANIFVGILRGHHIIYPKVLFVDIGQPFIFLVFLLVSIIFKLSLAGIIWAFTGAIVLPMILIGAYYFKKVDIHHPIANDSNEAGKDFIKFAVNLLILNILGMLMMWSDTLMLGRYAPVQEAGVYNVSMSLARLMLFPITAMEFAFMPVAGGLFSENRGADLKKTYQVLTKWLFSATFPIFFVLFFFPEMTIGFLFGAHYADSAMSLRILSAGFLFSAMLGTTGTLMVVMGRPAVLMKISAAAAFFNVVLNYIFIKHLDMGNAGAAFATVISYAVSSIITLLILYRISRIHPFTAQYIKPIIAAVLVGSVVYIIAKSFPLYFWMMPFYLLAYMSGYFACLIYAKGFERHDIDMFDAVVKKTGFEFKAFRRVLNNSVGKQ